MANHRIQVTEADIAKAEQNNSMRCVVASAIARTKPNATRIEVDLQAIRWTENSERLIYLTPYSVQGYVIAFDAGEEIQPFTFVLDDRRRVPVKSMRKTEAGKAVQRAVNKKRRSKEKAKQLELLAQGKAEPKPTPTEQKIAKALLPDVKQEVAEAEIAHESVRAAYDGAVQNERIGEGRNEAPRRMSKTRERHYGSRVLRINQEQST